VLDVKRLAFRVLLFLITVSAGISAQSTARLTWQWFQNCSDSTTITVEVLVDGKMAYHSSFPVCRVDASKMPHRQQRILVFRFQGGRQFQQRGIQTAPTQIVEGNIWQAGADPDDLILGVSFSTKKLILLNTIYTAQPGTPSTSEVDRGIVIRTFPLRR
jgi:hypothetical protein